MKRIAVILLAFWNIGAAAQDTAEQNNISFTGGVSFPIGDFASQKTGIPNAGMAATGYNFEIKYDHQFNEMFGIGTAFFYGHHAVHVPATATQSVPVKPWTYYQVFIGPVATGEIAPGLDMNVSLFTGASFINSPRVIVNDEVIAKKYSATAIPLKGEVDFRFFLNSKMFAYVGVSYTYLHATFNVTVEAQDLSFKQRMNTAAANAGFGWKL